MKQEEIISFYSYLQSQKTAQDYLKQCYEKIPGVDAEKKSYENANTFLYYLAHGRQFYENGKNLDLLLQPLLYFYGMVHLLKACLLTERPEYPESTSVLAHGVSARKRKKRNYIFSEDEVRIQHNGLLPYFTKHLFHLKYLPFEKIDMSRLLRLIPEISPLFSWHQQQPPPLYVLAAKGIPTYVFH
ncbi:YaaC family protein [Virgibacillus halophilus]|uniref:YaaC family protein n=1 Tax=Tigheibacillus halophilus TaxID=361280 RepID=A0ABU5C5X2_9BACI|nr:YaaC family protein [Virgibacillus halophilus]